MKIRSVQGVLGWQETHNSFSQWQSATGLDAHSKFISHTSDKRDTIFVNTTAYPLTVNLPAVPFYDLDNNSVGESITLSPFTSKVLTMDIVHVFTPIIMHGH